MEKKINEMYRLMNEMYNTYIDVHKELRKNITENKYHEKILLILSRLDNISYTLQTFGEDIKFLIERYEDFFDQLYNTPFDDTINYDDDNKLEEQ